MTSKPHSPAAIRLAENDELVLDIEKLVAGGDGFGRYQGIPIFVPRSAPGDRLRVRVTDRWTDYGRAEIVEILEPGPGRRKPPCPHFDSCGGCDLQHLEDKIQTDLKAKAVGETLERLAGLRTALPVEVIAGSPWGYRLRTQLQIEREADQAVVGYHARRSHTVVPVNSCPVLVPELEAILPRLPEVLSEPGPRRLDMAAGGDGSLSCAPMVAGLPHGELSLQVGDVDYRYDARCFFQVNRELLPKLIERTVGEATGEQAFDLFAGVGFFSLPLANRYSRVVAVEGDRIAARYARKNARHNHLENIEVVNRVVESWIHQLPAAPERVVVDPPRSGLSRPARERLLERRPTRLTYVSCHPAALARDLKAMLTTYRIESMTLIDLFPQTAHLEVVVQLIAEETK
ncbi:MAG: class I SAM-dependent RNA methyltransferase [Thermoanaerobaculia bacterium]